MQDKISMTFQKNLYFFKNAPETRLAGHQSA